MVFRSLLLAAVVAAVVVSPAWASAPPAAPGCPILPADSVWHADVSGLPVHARSAAWLGNMAAATSRLHPDFGPSGEAQPYGIPWVAVPDSHAKVTPSFQYADESDPGPYPFGPDTPIEGGSDRHALMLDRDTCVLSELYDADWNGGHPTAGSGAVFDLRSDALRPAGWTSADAAGLPMLPGLLRLDEVQAGHVDHAIRFTAARTDRSYLWPARHQAGAANDATLPPMGARFRLRAGFDLSGYRSDTQVVLRAMQHYGLLLADNGSNWFFQGTAESGWDPAFIDDLKRVPASAFEAVDESSLMVDPNSGRVRGAPPPPSATTAAPKVTAAPVRRPTVAPSSVPVATTTTVPDTTTSLIGRLSGPGPRGRPKSAERALGRRPPAGHGGRGWAPWLAGALVLAAAALIGVKLDRAV